MLIKALHMCHLNNSPAALLVLGAQLFNINFERIKGITKGVAIAVVWKDNINVGCIINCGNPAYPFHRVLS